MHSVTNLVEAARRELTDADYERLIYKRGGCICNAVSRPPCNAHDKPTEQELIDLGFDIEPPAADFMKAVRDACKGGS